ncbi:hypothetical protein H0E84_05440 [Luteimonas sp. SJ-92]|uniref:Uncharacterized protein n=1 Tax=Luteimonas salinisoli TaxID=2752307 RepID=A0A853JAZ1_9GAMM|nr:hypothetical protein [Luteimonas salinisoli]NZA25819.1 hypothetical protein [Luteimonas salinisoli]
MARKGRGFDLFARLPWPLAGVLGVLAYAAIRHGLPALATGDGPLLAGLRTAVDGGVLVPLAWIALAVLWLAALGNFLVARSRQREAQAAGDAGSSAPAPAGQADAVPREIAPTCPVCGTAMVKHGERGTEPTWACPEHPECRRTRAA